MERFYEKNNPFVDKNRNVKCIVCNDLIINKHLLLSATVNRCDRCLYKPDTRTDKNRFIEVIKNLNDRRKV